MFIADPNTYGFVCVTFRTSSDDVQTLMTNYSSRMAEIAYFDISVTSTLIDITLFHNKTNARKVIPIQQDCTEWTTFFLEYIPSKNKISEFRYLINNDCRLSGNFTFPLVEMQQTISAMCLLGCSWNKPFHYFQGDIAGLEVYSVSGIKDGQYLPKPLKELVIKNQLLIDEARSAKM